MDKGDSFEDHDGDGETEEEQSDTPEKRRKRLRLRRLRKKAQQSAYEFSGLSSLAGVLFLEIVEVTDLPPEKNRTSNPRSATCANNTVTRTTFDMDPFVVTSLGKRTYKTRIIRHNLNPVYKEKLVFNVTKHETRYVLNFSVVDRDIYSGNDFICSVDLPMEEITAVSPEADPETGLYAFKESEALNLSPTESRKSRFRIGMSRTTSTNSLHKATSYTRPPLQQSQSSLSVTGSQSLKSEASTAPTSTPSTTGNHLAPSSAAEPLSVKTAHDDKAHDDADLKSFQLPLKLKNFERWEDKHHPTLYIKAKYLPYRALRQSFWRAMLRQYDADDSGYMSKVELTTMLDTLGSTLHESTIDSFFEKWADDNENGELSIDHAVMGLEDLLQQFEEQGSRWMSKKATAKVAHAVKSRNASREDLTRVESSTSGRGLSVTESSSDTESQFVSTARQDSQGTSTLTDEFLEANDLADDADEEHVVEIRECPICHQPRLTKRSDADIITHIATCASQDWRQVNNIVMAGFVTSSQAQRKWYMKIVKKIGYGSYNIGSNSANILVQDRLTGLVKEERMSVYVRLGIRLMYKGLKANNMEGRRSKFPRPIHAQLTSQFANCYVACRISKAGNSMILNLWLTFLGSSTFISSTCLKCYSRPTSLKTSTSSSTGNSNLMPDHALRLIGQRLLPLLRTAAPLSSTDSMMRSAYG